MNSGANRKSCISTAKYQVSPMHYRIHKKELQQTNSLLINLSFTWTLISEENMLLTEGGIRFIRMLIEVI